MICDSSIFDHRIGYFNSGLLELATFGGGGGNCRSGGRLMAQTAVTVDTSTVAQPAP